jgi:hypothetical protein
MRAINSVLAAAAVGAVAIGCSVSAQASTLVELGMGSSPAVVGTSGATSASFSGSSGNFTTITLDGALGTAPDVLLGNSIDVASKAAGTLYLWVTATGLTTPSGSHEFISSLTSNTLTSNWTVAEKTFLDPTDKAFGTTDSLDSHTFGAIGTDVLTSANFGLVPPYSVTEEFIVTAPKAGGANSTIDVSVVPEPAAWSMMLLGIGLIGAGLRLARRKDDRVMSLA